MKRFLVMLASSAVLLSCSTVSMDVRTSDNPGTSSNVEKGQKIGKTIYNGWNVVDAWQDAVDKIGPHDELAIGQLATLSIISQVGDLVLEDEALVKYVNSVGNLVAMQGKRQVENPRTKGRRFFFGILRSKEANAFSTPGGNVLVTTGLLEKLSSESELAFVLGHEIAHVDYEHGLIAIKGAVKSDEALKSIVQLSLRKDKNKEPITNLFDDLKIFEKASYEIADLVVSKANVFSAGQERDADLTGLEYAAAAGYDARGGVRVMEILQESRGTGKTMSHGAPKDRTAALEKAASKHKNGKVGFARWQERGLARLEAAESAVAAPSATPAP